MFAENPLSLKQLPEDKRKYKEFIINQFRLTPPKELNCW